MKESVLDVLIYLFENYMTEESDPQPDQETLTNELHDAGFRNLEIDRAFDWLESLSDMCNEEQTCIDSPRGTTFRILTAGEENRIDGEAQGFLLSLEQLGILDSRTREMVIDRVMALQLDEISLEQIKWVTMIVLTNCMVETDDFVWIEDFLFEGVAPLQH
jgi:Smg protein